MTKKSWAKGRKDPSKLIRVMPEMHAAAVKAADEDKMTIRGWCSEAIRFYLTYRDKGKAA